MRDLPYAGDELAGRPPADGGGEHLFRPADPQPPGDHPPEISHGPAGGHEDATESVPGLPDWAGSDEGDWPGDGALAQDAGTVPGGAGDWPPSGRPPGVGRGHARRRRSRRSPRWLAPCAAVIVPALAAGAGLELVMVSSGASDGTFSGNGANAIASVGARTSPSEGVSTSRRRT